MCPEALHKSLYQHLALHKDMNKVLVVSAFLWVVASTDPLLLKLNPADWKEKATKTDDKNTTTAVTKKLVESLNLTVPEFSEGDKNGSNINQIIDLIDKQIDLMIDDKIDAKIEEMDEAKIDDKIKVMKEKQKLKPEDGPKDKKISPYRGRKTVVLRSGGGISGPRLGWHNVHRNKEKKRSERSGLFHPNLW